MIEKLFLRKDEKALATYFEEVLKGNISISEKELSLALSCGIPKVEFLALKVLKNFPINRGKDILKTILKLTDREADSFFKNKEVEFFFPVVGKTEKRLARGVAVPLDGERLISNLRITLPSILKNKGFVIFFDTPFVGNSFQAPFLIALKLGLQPKKFLFSGSVDIEGNFKAEKIEEKEEIAELLGKRLVTEGNAMSLVKLLKENKLEIPVLITTIPEVSFLEAVAKSAQIDLSSVLQILKVKKEELIIKLPAVLSTNENWASYVQEVGNSLKLLLEKGRSCFDTVHLHLGLRMPSALAAGIGASIGTGKIPVALYHFENGRYFKQIDLTENSRKIKKKEISEDLLLNFEEKKETPSCVVGIQLASHSVKGKPLTELVERTESSLAIIEHKTAVGALPVNLDWGKITAELYSTISQIHTDYPELHIVMSVPVVIAFSLGMALGNYWNVNLYQFERETGTYKKVLTLKELPLF